VNLSEALRRTRSALESVTDEAPLEAQLLVEKAAGVSRSALLTHPERELTAEQSAALAELTARRSQGTPLPYILGEWGFYGHMFRVNPAVLIPRPETEMLVEEASAWLKRHPEIRMGYDIGTGSGCIAVSLLLDRPDLRMTAVDRSREALKTAVTNARNLGCGERFFPVLGDLASALRGGSALICANLPYIPSETCEDLEAARFEPLSALDGGADGFELYRRLFADLAPRMKPGSLLLCEIEYRQEQLAADTAAAYFPNADIRVMRDLAGQPRLLRIEE
jgi:release factor glutamine methyltransferase